MKKYISFLLLFLCLPLCAQQLDITAQHVPQQASFAQPFDTRFELAHTPGYLVDIDKNTLPQGFTLTAVKSEALSPGTLAYDLTFMPFTLGISTFTAVTFDLRERAGAAPVAHARSKSVHINVKPVKYFDEDTLRDIRPPYIPAGWGLWLAILILIGLIIYFLRHWQRNAAARALAAAAAPDDRPADVIALSKIQALLQSGLWEQAQYKLFYISLGDILREYFWRRFNQDVSSDTSAELLRRARKIPQLSTLLYPLRQYLNSSDLVKFAKVTPNTAMMQKDVQTVQQIVRDTSPQASELTEDKA